MRSQLETFKRNWKQCLRGRRVLRKPLLFHIYLELEAALLMTGSERSSITRADSAAECLLSRAVRGRGSLSLSIRCWI
ncbi:unnamed protein product [Nezara viridula]|uniref:Uncharacterized protein n=1 Tax=Nezara viridula TaxID=85310 RepID=A0A9P0E975_NEZVI|nr:unnamed protein product [Nezara viridula]